MKPKSRRIVKPPQRATYYNSRRASRNAGRGSQTWSPSGLSWSQLLKIGFSIVVIIGLVGLYRAVTVNTVTVSSAQPALNAQVTTLVHEEVAQHILWQNLITIDLGGMSSQMMTRDYGLASVVITRQWPHTLLVSIAEKQPSFIWVTGSNRYFLDSNGGIIGPEMGESTLPLFRDGAALPVKAGERVVPASFMAFCTTLLDELPKTNLTAAELDVPDTTGEVDVKTTAGYVVKFDSTGSVGRELGDLIATLNQLASLHRTPTQYIDLRIPERIYYQ